MAIKLLLTSSSGYYAMMEFNSVVPSVIKLFEKLYMGTSILLLVYLGNKTNWYRFLSIITTTWSLVAALTGDRTVGLAGLITIALIKFTIGDRSQKRHSFSRYITILVFGIAVMYLVSIAFSFRMQSDISTTGLGDTLVNAIGTFGFSFFPLVLVMQIYPSFYNFEYGKSFLGGIVHGLIPENFDFLGLTNVFKQWNSESTNLLDSYYKYGFGLDFSLNAECYVNFGGAGWIAMFFLCAVIATLLKEVNFKRLDNLFTQYSVLILLYSWFTLPRRKSYYVFNNFFWYIIVLGVLLLLVRKFLYRNKV
jgi:hypothetical protein